LDGALPRILKMAGYGTLTVSSSNSRYYSAAEFHRSLGMDSYQGCETDAACDGKLWSEVPDRAAFSRAMKAIHDSKEPMFVFVTTIRQHSPHLPRESYTDIAPDNLQRKQEAILAEYGQRLDQSVADFKWFAAALAEEARPTVLAAFGDHIPSDVAKFFSERELPGRQQTFFTVYRTDEGYITDRLVSELGPSDEIDIAYLDMIALRAVGLQTPYSDAKIELLRKYNGQFPEMNSNQPLGKEK